MSTTGVITTLLTIIGILIIGVVKVFLMYWKDKDSNKSNTLDDHEKRIHELEMNMVEQVVHREEMGDMFEQIRKQGGV